MPQHGQNENNIPGNSQPNVRVALLGYGYAGKTFHAPLIANTPGMSLDAVMSSDASKVKADFPEANVSSDAAAIFADENIDLVVIATPNSTHHPLAEQALKAGKHVVVDKPFALSVSEAESLRLQSEQSGKVLSIFHNRRWDADFLTVQTLIRDGSLGDVKYFQSNIDRYRPTVRQRWREQAIAGSGLWFDLGPHLVDQALMMFGLPNSITADLEIQRSGGQATDYFHVILNYDEMRVVLHSSCLVPGESHRYIVHGSLGTYTKYGIDVQEEQLKNGQNPSSAGWAIDPVQGTLTVANPETQTAVSTTKVENKPGDYLAYYRQVRGCISGENANPVSAQEAINVMRILELAEESAQFGKRIALKN